MGFSGVRDQARPGNGHMKNPESELVRGVLVDFGQAAERPRARVALQLGCGELGLALFEHDKEAPGGRDGERAAGVQAGGRPEHMQALAELLRCYEILRKPR